VARMREFYRRRSGSEPLVEVDINQIVEEAIELTRPRWRDISQRDGVSVEMRQELERPLPALWSDPSELREALFNLIFNAVDALPQGGTVTFGTHLIPAQKNGGEQQLQIEVRDNGVGMDEKTRQHCLEPFFSTKSLRGGSGLGLAMVYGMMQRHEGTVEIESSPGKGTCVRLVFPVRQRKGDGGQESGSGQEAARSLRVLCVDDDPVIRQLLDDCLTQFNHRVSTVASGEEALKLFRSARESGQPFEVVITDLGMPHMDGNQLARMIKTEAPGTPIVMMTGWGTMMKEDGAQGPEADALMGKPPQIRELNNLLLRIALRKTDGHTSPLHRDK